MMETLVLEVVAVIGQDAVIDDSVVSGFHHALGVADVGALSPTSGVW